MCTWSFKAFPFLVFLLQSFYRLNRDLRTQETEQKDRQAELRQQQEEIKEKSREAIAIRETLTKGEATFHYNNPLSLPAGRCIYV